MNEHCIAGVRQPEAAMARNTLMPTTGRGPSRIIVTTVVVVALVIVLHDPVGAASAAHHFGAWIGGVIDGLSRFGSALAH